MTNKCYRCNQNDVSEEFQRCPSCEISHKELCAKLDARPRVKNTKIKEELFPIYETKQGIKVTTYIDKNYAMIMGITLPAKRK